MPTYSRPLTRWHWLVPAAVLAAGTAAVWIGDLDHAAAALFYSASDPTHWPTGYGQPWALLYRWGVMPAIVLAAAGLLLLARSYWGRRGGGTGGASAIDPAQRRALRRAGAMIVLSLALGPLLLVNGVLHETWGRPRPRQVVEFGGTRTFRPVLLPIRDRQAQSFPSGHAAAGHALLVLYFVWRERHPRLAWAGLAAGLGLGIVAGWARMAQGGHWLSDCLWSAGIVWFAAWAVARGMEWRSASSARRAPSAAPRAEPHPWAAAAYAAGAVGLCAWYLAFLPILERLDRSLPLPAGAREVRLELDGPPPLVHTAIGAGADAHITVTLSGRGAPWVALADRWEPAPVSNGVVRGRYGIAVAGYRSGHNLELWINAPAGVQVAVSTAAPAAGARSPK